MPVMIVMMAFPLTLTPVTMSPLAMLAAVIAVAPGVGRSGSDVHGRRHDRTRHREAYVERGLCSSRREDRRRDHRRSSQRGGESGEKDALLHHDLPPLTDESIASDGGTARPRVACPARSRHSRAHAASVRPTSV